MGWHYDSTAGATIWDTEILSPEELACRDEELQWLIRNERRGWKIINGRLHGSGVPTAMAEGTYGALGAYPLPVSESALTLSATEQALVPAAQLPVYLPLPINGMLAPQAYRFILTGVGTTVATSGTLTNTVRLGNTNTSPSLGASAAQTWTASLTNSQWCIKGDITIRTIGLPGANSTAIGTFQAFVNSTVGGAVTSWLWGTGTTAVSFDTTIAAGANGGCIWVGVTFSANFPTMTVQQVHFMDWN